MFQFNFVSSNELNTKGADKNTDKPCYQILNIQHKNKQKVLSTQCSPLKFNMGDNNTVNELISFYERIKY